MNKTIVYAGIAGFLLGIGCGFLVAPKTRDIGSYQPMLTSLTSQGRAEVQKMISEINAILDEDIGEIMAEKTRALQAITAKEPDRAAADFYRAGMEDKMNKTQAKIDKIVLDSIQNMPLIDRRTYMKFYAKNRSALKLRSIVLPLIAATGFDDMDGELVLKPRFPTVNPS
ncbi:MAG: periplasmic heavy metal sensor [Alphaproteobacteria bacterium]|nr:periplasmic heavy metal sensor [Alphaproteobacteria bacterium]MBO4643264.1 periplasmic heavy metal sensor [Alphaproteobacteria bacterium]